MKTRTEPKQCSRDYIHVRHTWTDDTEEDEGESFWCPGLREHDFQGFPLVCTRVGCGIHEEGLLEQEKFCKACSNCGSDEAVVCEICRPGQAEAIRAAQADFQLRTVARSEAEWWRIRTARALGREQVVTPELGPQDDGSNLATHKWPKTALKGEDYSCLRCPTRWSEGDQVDCAGVAKPRRTQIHVVHNNETNTYHPVSDGEGWRIDAGRGTLIIGKGLGRVEVPLCNVLYFSPEEIS